MPLCIARSPEFDRENVPEGKGIVCVNNCKYEIDIPSKGWLDEIEVVDPKSKKVPYSLKHFCFNSACVEL
jgi:hypothetical protein